MLNLLAPEKFFPLALAAWGMALALLGALRPAFGHPEPLPWAPWAPIFAATLIIAVLTWWFAAPQDRMTRRFTVLAVLVWIEAAPVSRLPHILAIAVHFCVAATGIVVLV